MSKNNFILFLVIILGLTHCSFGTINDEAALSQTSRGLYVNDFNLILGDATAEESLLSFAQQNSITYLLFYDLQSLWNDETLLKNFISTAKNDYGILEVGACGQSTEFFENVIQFNNQSESDIDVLNLEYEYWLSDPHDFDTFIDKLDDMKNIAEDNNLVAEAYVGWMTEDETADIATLVDRLLVHAYVETPQEAYSAAEERLEWLSALPTRPEIWIIFSVEDEFMGGWIEDNSLLKAENGFLQELLDDNLLDLNLIDGFQYFAYGDF